MAMASLRALHGGDGLAACLGLGTMSVGVEVGLQPGGGTLGGTGESPTAGADLLHVIF